MKEVVTIKKVFSFAESIQEYLKIVKAFVKGYEAFIFELKNESNEKE